MAAPESYFHWPLGRAAILYHARRGAHAWANFALTAALALSERASGYGFREKPTRGVREIKSRVGPENPGEWGHSPIEQRGSGFWSLFF